MGRRRGVRSMRRRLGLGVRERVPAGDVGERRVDGEVVVVAIGPGDGGRLVCKADIGGRKAEGDVTAGVSGCGLWFYCSVGYTGMAWYTIQS